MRTRTTRRADLQPLCVLSHGVLNALLALVNTRVLFWSSMFVCIYIYIVLLSPAVPHGGGSAVGPVEGEHLYQQKIEDVFVKFFFLFFFLFCFSVSVLTPSITVSPVLCRLLISALFTFLVSCSPQDICRESCGYRGSSPAASSSSPLAAVLSRGAMEAANLAAKSNTRSTAGSFLTTTSEASRRREDGPSSWSGHLYECTEDRLSLPTKTPGCTHPQEYP